jgi:toxin ParE1/3/4
VGTYAVVFAPEAEEQLLSLYRFISTRTAPIVAERYVSEIMTFCEGLSVFPLRGNQRDDIRPGLRITNYRKRVVIAFAVDGERVEIMGVFYGGQDFEAVLGGDG